MTDVYSDAVVELLPADATHPQIAPTTIILHTNGGGDGDLYQWFKTGVGQDVQSHNQVTSHGTVYQYMRWVIKANAQFSANAFAISIETGDHGDPSIPWTALQLAAIVEVIVEACRLYNIPAVQCPAATGGGIGWHSQFPEWNQDGHGCPGPVRVNQIVTTVIPAVAAALKPPSGGEMAQTVNKNGYIEQFRAHPDGSVSHRYQNAKGWQYDPSFSPANTVDAACPMSASLNQNDAVEICAVIGGKDAHRWQKDSKWTDWTTVF